MSDKLQKQLTMKKLLILLVLITSCGDMGTQDQYIQMLQSKYSIVYRIGSYQYICIDTIHVYKVNILTDGKILSTVRIK